MKIGKNFLTIGVVFTTFLSVVLFSSNKVDPEAKKHVLLFQKWTGLTPHQTFGSFAGLSVYSTYRSLANFLSFGGYMFSALNTGLSKLFNEPTNKSVIKQTGRGSIKLIKSPLQLIGAAYFSYLADATMKMYPKVKKDVESVFKD